MRTETSKQFSFRRHEEVIETWEAKGSPRPILRPKLLKEIGRLEYDRVFPFGEPSYILTTENFKIRKSELNGKGYRSLVHHRSPAIEAIPFGAEQSGCTNFTDACFLDCIASGTGRLRFNLSLLARVRRTLWLERSPETYCDAIIKELIKHTESAWDDGLEVCLRNDGTTDLGFEGGLYPILSFCQSIGLRTYDYTKNPERMRDFSKGLLGSHHLTFSLSDAPSSEPDAIEFLDAGSNVAVVFQGEFYDGHFALSDGKPRELVNGDEHDLTFLHSSDAGRIIHLKAKGTLRSRDTEFKRER